MYPDRPVFAAVPLGLGSKAVAQAVGRIRMWHLQENTLTKCQRDSDNRRHPSLRAYFWLREAEMRSQIVGCQECFSI
jgi:hypothetical protein